MAEPLALGQRLVHEADVAAAAGSAGRRGPAWSSWTTCPEAKSSRSTSAVRRPRAAASRAAPTPVMPPPITRTSKPAAEPVDQARRSKSIARSIGRGLAGYRRASPSVYGRCEPGRPGPCPWFSHELSINKSCKLGRAPGIVGTRAIAGRAHRRLPGQRAEDHAPAPVDLPTSCTGTSRTRRPRLCTRRRWPRCRPSRCAPSTRPSTTSPPWARSRCWISVPGRSASTHWPKSITTSPARGAAAVRDVFVDGAGPRLRPGRRGDPQRPRHQPARDVVFRWPLRPLSSEAASRPQHPPTSRPRGAHRHG